MPRLSLWKPNKQNDYKFLDRTITEMFTVGGTDLYIHKYLGPADTGPSTDFTQPQYLEPDPTKIQDLLFLENRDRKYDSSIYRLRGHYSVQNLDFDLSQFGLFLNNDIIFVTTAYNAMIDIIGRKLMVGDVLELPHLLDYNPLNETIPVALKRFYQITDSNYASEGFSQTWYPHVWRIKCEPLVNSEEFSDILDQPINQDNYLGDFDPLKTYPAGYTITYGGKVYEAITDVPVGITPPNETYWKVIDNGSLADILSTYNKNIAINDAALEEARRLVPLSGYDTSKMYIVPTYGAWESNGVPSNKYDQPAPPINLNTYVGDTGTIVVYNNPAYRYPSAGIRIKPAVLKSLQEQYAFGNVLDAFLPASLQMVAMAPVLTEAGSGSVESTYILSVSSIGGITGPYGTADNTYATADQNPVAPGFTGDITQAMDYRADCDPRFQYISRASPRSFGYSAGYLSGDGKAPNGYATGAGISFPQNPQVGDYFLRIDYAPQLLYRWNGQVWIRISENVRTDTGFTVADQSLLSGFINDKAELYLNNEGKLVPESQSLSTILKPTPDVLPPQV